MDWSSLDWIPALTVGIGVLAIMIGNLTVMLPILRWFREDTKDEIKAIKENVDAMRIETTALINAIKDDAKEFRQLMHEEMKDFHSRLISLETRRNMEEKQADRDRGNK